MNQTTRIIPQGLAQHEAQVAQDLEALNLPPRNWVPAISRDGVAVRDVVVIGAGMNGIAAAGALIFKGIRNIAVLEASAPGQEGPWVTTARMDTLRSPKTLPGPCFGIPSLTFRAWYVASFGAEAWEALYKIHNATWQDYLGWLQRVLRLPVEHGVRVARISPYEGVLRLTLSDGRTLLARRVVMATGRAGAGGLHMPDFVAPDLFPDLAALAPTPIDFTALRGKSLGLIGGGASAWDNAATALEQGAAEAHLYVRRATLPQINKGRGSAGPGFHQGWDSLSLQERWDLIVYMHDAQAPPPHETVKRALRLPGFQIHLATPVRAARRGDAGVVLDLGGREVRHDFLIVGTGFVVDMDRVPELADFAPHIARWEDCYTPPEALRRPEMAAFPFLGGGFELQPRDASAPAELGLIHMMNYGAHASHGGIASDIPGVAVAGERVSLAILRHLFQAEIGALRDELSAFDEPELEGTPFFVPR
ncbi:NAD(P)/FAD-dependent oxidoreductase [Sediminicoccus sp. KRV36]|uniref:FAD/NAD(P)-binding protein n=1 Tax=Sediminicoccus sp. KRV36 TaxID=3133721 RepID=UPI00200CCB02|nr:NAD(P)/FAD-dependent oxidoreductase [Sediminicoccus rosea]UPY37180.1 NAD(P)/FAD-dependent oxidoreductase [Sediminicoccus rosea]